MNLLALWGGQRTFRAKWSVNCLNIEEICLIEWVIKGTSVVNRISTGFFYGLGFPDIPTR